MKIKRVFFTFIFSFCSFIFFSQDTLCVKKWNLIIDGYYGGITLVNKLVKSKKSDSTFLDYKGSVFGPIGARIELLISKNFSIGFDIQYNQHTMSWKEINSNPPPDLIENKLIWYRVRYMAKFCKYVDITKQGTGYFSFSLGYLESRLKVISGDKNEEGIFAVPPVAFRFAAGYRFPINKFFGAFLELGIFGGGLLHGGFYLKPY
ncbi:MAG: hypothetical protein KatS3mg027_0688 [Bacteroidia bacterium]|nr:MAG: hypothetical protein KatS3mg027_0688 [Bacteroidia bacterium]